MKVVYVEDERIKNIRYYVIISPKQKKIMYVNLLAKENNVIFFLYENPENPKPEDTAG